MPNWVRNIVYAMDENANFEEFTNEKQEFTFEKIIPMPEDIYRGGLGAEERKKYGSKNWYDWSIANWGTKWDANSNSVEATKVEFDTAWSCPLPVLIELGKRVGGIIALYADEGIPKNSGGYIINAKGEVKEISCEVIARAVIYEDVDIHYREEVISEFGWLAEEDD